MWLQSIKIMIFRCEDIFQFIQIVQILTLFNYISKLKSDF
jgi:hypothetical protein